MTRRSANAVLTSAASGLLVAIAAALHSGLCEWEDWADRVPAQKVLIRLGDTALLVRQPGHASRSDVAAVGIGLPAGLIGWAVWLQTSGRPSFRRRRRRRFRQVHARHCARPRTPLFRALGPAGPSCTDRLGVAFPCTADQIKAAFRQRSRRAHPDQGGSAEQFIALRAAYEECLRYAGPTPQTATSI